jgi:hypothetical protein
MTWEQIRLRFFTGNRMHRVWAAVRVLFGLEYALGNGHCAYCDQRLEKEYYSRHYQGQYGPVGLRYHGECLKELLREQHSLDKIFGRAL